MNKLNHNFHSENAQYDCVNIMLLIITLWA